MEAAPRPNDQLFATATHDRSKRHWRSKSKLPDIVAGLEDLARVLQEREVASVAVPPLGCGHGGLNWDDVRPRIEVALGGLAGTRVLLFAPVPRAAVHNANRRSRPTAKATV